MVSPRTFGHLDISSWRVTLRRCPDRTTALFSGRTARAEAASWQARVCKARRLPPWSCDPRDVGPSYPRFRHVGLLAPMSPSTWHELAIVPRERGDGGAVHASSIGRGVVARPSGSPQSGGHNASSFRSFDREQDHVVAETGGHELEAPEPNHRGARNRRNKGGHLERDGKLVKKNT